MSPTGIEGGTSGGTVVTGKTHSVRDLLKRKLLCNLLDAGLLSGFLNQAELLSRRHDAWYSLQIVDGANLAPGFQ